MPKEVNPPEAPVPPMPPKMPDPQIEQLQRELHNTKLIREGMFIIAQALNKEMLMVDQTINQLSMQLKQFQNKEANAQTNR